MRSFLRILILFSLLGVMLLTVVYAQEDAFYAKTDGNPGGVGSAQDPRRAADAEELAEDACPYFGDQLLAGKTKTVYWILSVGSVSMYYTYTVDDAGDCTLTRGLTSGNPPGFGVTLTPPLIVAGLVVLGLVLLALALVLRRRFQPSAPST